MDRKNAIRIASSLPATAKVLDVGGGSAPFPRADYVLDADLRGWLVANEEAAGRRHSQTI